MPLKNISKRCKAKCKRTGEQCQNPAVTGYDVCYFHGANPKNRGGRKKGSKASDHPRKGPVGKQNALKHGAYSPRLSPEELPVYEQFLSDYLEDVPNPSVTDRRALERLAVLETKWHTAVSQGAPPDALDVLHRLLHRELKALQVTRESKDTTSTAGTTPAEVVASLLMQVQERAIETRRSPALSSDDDVVDAVVVDADPVEPR